MRAYSKCDSSYGVVFIAGKRHVERLNLSKVISNSLIRLPALRALGISLARMMSRHPRRNMGSAKRDDCHDAKEYFGTLAIFNECKFKYTRLI